MTKKKKREGRRMSIHDRWQWDEDHPEGRFVEEPDGTLFVLGAGGERLEPTAWQRRYHAALLRDPDEALEMLKECHRRWAKEK